MRAGDAIVESIPGLGTKGCTAGFGAKEKTGTIRGQATWAFFPLTAGHCREFSNAKEFYRSTEVVPSPSNTATWRSIGLTQRDGLEANTSVKTDAGAIETTDGDLVPQGIFGEAGNLIPTRSAVTSKIGSTLCFSGAATRQPSCGKVVARSFDWQSEPGSFGREGYRVKFPVQAIQGDSYAPVYTIFGHAVGLVTACRPINSCTETLVEPLLHPLHMPSADVPGIFNNPYLGQLSLKLGAE